MLEKYGNDEIPQNHYIKMEPLGKLNQILNSISWSLFISKINMSSLSLLIQDLISLVLLIPLSPATPLGNAVTSASDMNALDTSVTCSEEAKRCPVGFACQAGKCVRVTPTRRGDKCPPGYEER